MKPSEWVLSAPTILTVAGLDFVVHNNGHHIIIDHGGHKYHLWPSTGTWGVTTNRGFKPHAASRKHPGVRGIVRFLNDIVVI